MSTLRDRVLFPIGILLYNKIVTDKKFILSSTLTNALQIFVFLEAVLALRILWNFGNLSVIIAIVLVLVVIVLIFIIVVLSSKDFRHHVMYPTCALVRSHRVLALGVLRTYLRCRLAFINI